MAKRRTIVFGTTSDYIEILDSRFPGRLLFATDLREAGIRDEFSSHETTEYVCDLEKSNSVLPGLVRYMEEHGIEPSGITCFDCESLIQAARIAEALSLSFPSPESVVACRSKFTSKQIWHKNGILCPKMKLIRSLSQVLEFFEQTERPLVLKPVSGSGSELVFRCDNKIELMRAYHDLLEGLRVNSNRRMYNDIDQVEGVSSREIMIAEEFIQGREYSCDILLDGDRFEIIRIAKKLPYHHQPPGTVMAYIMPATLPGELDFDAFSRQLRSAAMSLGLKRTIAMVDFIVHHDSAYILEMTPRPGGDCLPQMMLAGSGFDILGAAIDFAENKPVYVPPIKDWRKVVGLRLYATAEGIIKSIDTCRLSGDDRIIAVDIRRKPGHMVILPPENYDSRFLGNVIFVTGEYNHLELECRTIADNIIVNTESLLWTPEIRQ